MLVDFSVALALALTVVVPILAVYFRAVSGTGSANSQASSRDRTAAIAAAYLSRREAMGR